MTDEQGLGNMLLLIGVVLFALYMVFGKVPDPTKSPNYELGYETGYEDGYSDGTSDGYAEGYDAALKEYGIKQ